LVGDKKDPNAPSMIVMVEDSEGNEVPRFPVPPVNNILNYRKMMCMGLLYCYDSEFDKSKEFFKWLKRHPNSKKHKFLRSQKRTLSVMSTTDLNNIDEADNVETPVPVSAKELEKEDRLERKDFEQEDDFPCFFEDIFHILFRFSCQAITQFFEVTQDTEFIEIDPSCEGTLRNMWLDLMFRNTHEDGKIKDAAFIYRASH
jgi:hypothetical protein